MGTCSVKEDIAKELVTTFLLRLLKITFLDLRILSFTGRQCSIHL